MPVVDRLGRPVLVLNASYEPINVCAARRALVLVLKGVATAEEHAPLAIHSARHNLKLPSVIRLIEYRRIPHQTRALSRKNILMRDRYTCQYCLRTPPGVELDVGSRDSALAGRGDDLGEPGCVLPRMQQQEGESHAGGGGHETGSCASPVQFAHKPSLDASPRKRRRPMAQVPLLLAGYCCSCGATGAAGGLSPPFDSFCSLGFSFLMGLIITCALRPSRRGCPSTVPYCWRS